MEESRGAREHPALRPESGGQLLSNLIDHRAWAPRKQWTIPVIATRARSKSYGRWATTSRWGKATSSLPAAPSSYASSRAAYGRVAATRSRTGAPWRSSQTIGQLRVSSRSIAGLSNPTIHLPPILITGTPLAGLPLHVPGRSGPRSTLISLNGILFSLKYFIVHFPIPKKHVELQFRAVLTEAGTQ